MSKGLLIVVSGFTGSGKGTVLQKLTEMAPEKYTRCITMTTRAMRPGEQDGIDYIFCSKEEFKRLLDQQKNTGMDMLCRKFLWYIKRNDQCSFEIWKKRTDYFEYRRRFIRKKRIS